MTWQTTRFAVDLSTPLVMGIVNVTPDSFSDGGYFDSPRLALKYCEHLLSLGAHMLDIGGESSRPGAKSVSLEDELARIMPVVRGALALGVPISVDTYKPEVMRAVLDAGADIINDIWALRQPGAVSVVAEYPRCGVVLMHMHREPETMQVVPMAGEVTPAVLRFVQERMAVLASAGVALDRLCIDPGIGFGKTPAQNFELLRRQTAFLQLGVPVLCGWSRKSSLGAATGLDVAARMVPSVTAAILSATLGARVLRVHDVRETVEAVKIFNAMNFVA